jgi:hypothetical protein
MTRRGLLLLCCVLVPHCPTVQADGGAVRLSRRQGDYRITVFTEPNPFRAGPVDISVLVQDASTGRPMPRATVTVRAAPRDRPSEAVLHPATREAATNKLFRAALFELPEPGWWDFEVAIEGDHGPAKVYFDLKAAEPSPAWWRLWPWLGWPVLVIVLFLVHEGLVWRKERR